jgi:hypothetical protein
LHGRLRRRQLPNDAELLGDHHAPVSHWALIIGHWPLGNALSHGSLGRALIIDH